jgi:hypothetical protein
MLAVSSLPAESFLFLFFWTLGHEVSRAYGLLEKLGAL